jgi:hypothetical protein
VAKRARQKRPLAKRSAVGVAQLAEFFALAGRREADHDGIFGVSMVPFFLFGHAIELCVKSFLVGRGVSEHELSRVLGHDLDAAFERARHFADFASVDVSEEDLAIVQELNRHYEGKELEYPSPGRLRLPFLGALDSFTFKLLEAIKPLANKAAVAALNDPKPEEPDPVVAAKVGHSLWFDPDVAEWITEQIDGDIAKRSSFVNVTIREAMEREPNGAG